MSETAEAVSPLWERGLLAALLFLGCLWLRARARGLDADARVRALWILAPALPGIFLLQDWAFARWPWPEPARLPAQVLFLGGTFLLLGRIATPQPAPTAETFEGRTEDPG